MTAAAAHILSYDWIVGNIQNFESKIVFSKMILYRGEKVFRVGVHFISLDAPIVSLVAINLNGMGLKVHRVTASISQTDEIQSRFDELTEDLNQSDNLQKFSNKIPHNSGTNTSFHFRILKGNNR